MSCAKGCCDTQAEHYRSLRVASPDRTSLTKTTTDDHGTHRVDVIEHYTDRQDVTVHAPRVAVRTATTTEKG
jgi:hypothetical protein